MRGVETVRGAAGDLCAGKIEVGGAALEAVFGHGDDLGVEGVGLDDVGAGIQVEAVNVFDDLRLGEIERVVIAAQVFGMAGELGAAEIGLGEAAGLDHGAHGAVDQEDALAQALG